MLPNPESGRQRRIAAVVARARATLDGMAKKRSYSREFTPRSPKRVMLTIDRIPPTLYDAVRAKAKREGVSLRALVLGWLKAWSEQ